MSVIRFYKGASAPDANTAADVASGAGLAVGDIWIDTGESEVKRATSISPVTFVNIEGSSGGTGERAKAITVEDPTDAEDISIFFTNKAITITEMRAVVRGTTPSVTWTIRHGTDRSAAGAEVVTGGTTTTSESSGSDVTSFNDATIVADSFVWLETTAQTGTVDEIAIAIVYTVD